ncbi:glutathione S-transferase family protein [Methylobacterium sp. NEAU 140]|uniref:glutathione S-transferase family protein n=1 Tax=Methylobacterium sp. NEAU 140 TaxID=3064945 RepID=UPI0027336A42|nr:glutathione S-transferase family protein [Methylobacterium sp. NEAU 140]MDP4023192.1 glutathione S-transferase family protein [Methylobacterium sp. NEAU 140]
MIVYGTSVSPFVRKVLVALAEKGVAYEHRPVAPQAKDLEFRAASPTGKVPAIEDEGFRLADSSAILHYIEAVHPEPSLIPSGARDRARAVWFDEYADGECFPRMVVPFVERFLKPRLYKVAGDDALAQRTIDEGFPPLFDYLEGQIDGPYLVGGAFSIADIAVASPFHNLRLVKFAPDAERWPRLAAWVSATLERPSFVAAIAAAKA